MFDRIISFAANALGLHAKTPPQSASGGILSDPIASSDPTAALGFEPCPGPTIRTYREMLRNPTIQIGLRAAKSPVVQSEWSVESEDGVPDEVVSFVSDYCLVHRPMILREGLKAVEFGYYPFEIVWDTVDSKIVPAKLKPLRPEKTEILTDKTTGAFLGLRNGGVALEPDDCLLFSLDGEAGDFRGRSRLENIRTDAWWPWKSALTQTQNYTRKAAGIIPRVQYPVGTSKDRNGTIVDNSEIARQVMDTIMRGKGVCMPRVIDKSGEGLVARGIDPSPFMSWQIDFIEAGGSHGSELSDMLTKFEALMLRGLYVPERSITEGANGTKAEAETHSSVMVDMAESTLEQIMEVVNWHLVDKAVRRNFGENWVGMVWIKAAPIKDDKLDMLSSLVRDVLANPQNVDLLLSTIDLPTSAELIGLPVREHAADIPSSPPGGNTDQAIAQDALQAGLILRAG